MSDSLAFQCLSKHPLANRLASLSQWAGSIAVLCVGALALLTGVLVVLRKLVGFNHIGMDELRWHLFGVSFLLGMALTLHKGGHVRVDILSSRFPPVIARLVELFSLWLIAVPVCALIAWGGWNITLAKFQMMEGSPEAQGLPYRFLIRGCIPLGFGLLGLQAFLQGVLVCLTWKEVPPVDEPPHEVQT